MDNLVTFLSSEKYATITKTSILGTNIVENFFSIMCAKTLHPNLSKLAVIYIHAVIKIMKWFSTDQLHNNSACPLSKPCNMKYNDQTGISFELSCLDAYKSMQQTQLPHYSADLLELKTAKDIIFQNYCPTTKPLNMTDYMQIGGRGGAAQAERD